MASPLLLLQDIELTFGGRPLLAGAGLSVALGDRVCLVGRNGSGKSTLLRIAAGLVRSDAGRRFAQPGATIRYLPQEPDVAGFATTLAYVEAPAESEAGVDRHRAQSLLEQLGLTGREDPTAMSGGELRRIALARALAPSPDILLLDEPTNHLDLPGIEWLERALGGLRSGIVVISHDRRLLERLSRTTVWLDRGATRSLDESFAGFEAWRDAVLEQEETDRHKLDRKIAMEEDWLRYGVSGRRKRNQKRLGDLHAMRADRRNYRGPTGTARLEAAQAEASGRLVAAAEKVAKSYGDRAIVRPFSIRILRGDRVGIVGPNGAGKTTLLNLMTGVLMPDSGEVRLGTNLEQVTLDQRRETLDPAETLSHALTGGGGDRIDVGGENRHVMGYLKEFLFRPEQAGTPVGVLSGGERARLTLARAFARRSNLMVLDEPTNDLDLETLDLLQERLAEYAGTVLLVSHDRDFLDRIVTSVIAGDGDGRWTEYAGGYSDMLVQRAASPSGAIPARPREKPEFKVASAQTRPGQRSPPSDRPRRMTFKDRQELENLPGRIAALETEIARLNQQLEDAGLYARDRRRFDAATGALDTAQRELAAAEDQWLALELLRDEIAADQRKS